ncbi:hypothetical protein ACFQ0M_03195 [Kitasatospora aburaviensis]
MASSRVLPEPAPAGPLHGPDRSAGPDVVLIGYQDQGNLGMGYLAAVLQERGRTVDLIDVREGRSGSRPAWPRRSRWSSASR